VTCDRDHYLASSNLVMNFELHERQENSLTVGDFQLLKKNSIPFGYLLHANTYVEVYKSSVKYIILFHHRSDFVVYKICL
jgi:hypothetical protein